MLRPWIPSNTTFRLFELHTFAPAPCPKAPCRAKGRFRAPEPGLAVDAALLVLGAMLPLVVARPPRGVPLSLAGTLGQRQRRSGGALAVALPAGSKEMGAGADLHLLQLPAKARQLSSPPPLKGSWD